jgi:hypothetical protein
VLLAQEVVLQAPVHEQVRKEGGEGG